MKVVFKGQSNPLALINGKVYDVEAIEFGWYRIVDETQEDYLYQAYLFDIVEDHPLPPRFGEQ
jgi:hypothetical protein